MGPTNDCKLEADVELEKWQEESIGVAVFILHFGEVWTNTENWVYFNQSLWWKKKPPE